MGNLFAGLSSGNTALSYYRRGIETAGHNIANAGTEGFARQRVNINANAPVKEGLLSLGQGVSVDSITRIRNLFLDAQYRAQLPTLGYWETRADNLKNLEFYSGEIDRSTFRTALDDYWSKHQNLHIHPQEASARETLIESTKKMITSLTHMRKRYDDYRFDLNDRIRDMVKEANDLIDDIALLCRDISEVRNKGGNPNDLLDKRDLLAERLCKLTGATVGSPSLDESDGDYRIDINGKMLIQGGAQFNCSGNKIKNTRHLVLVPMIGNNSYFDVQIEDNLYDHISDLSVASVVIERGATDPASCSRNGIHELFVERLANGKTWTVGGAPGKLDGGERLDTIYAKDEALGIEGSFSLQVGSVGVRASSRPFDLEGGKVIGQPIGTEPREYEFRIAAGDYESYVNIKYNDVTNRWDIRTDGGETLLGTSAGVDLVVSDIQSALSRYTNFYVEYEKDAERFSIEAANNERMRGHLLSITDVRGALAAKLGIANKNPSVEITVKKDDTLTTIANKINAVYQSDLVFGTPPPYPTNPPETAPSRPEEWLHANVVREPNGSFYITLTSNVSGEANRINVLPGSVCGANGDFSVAKLLGFTDSKTNATAYMQINANPKAGSTIDRSAPYVDDAYFIFDGRHYLSESNRFAEARVFKTTDGHGGLVRWDNPKADVLARFGRGIRLNLNGLNRYYDDRGSLSGNEPTIITVRPHLTNGEIFSTLESRDDLALGFEDYFDKIVFEMVTESNAVHYSGHGIGDNIDTTGTAFYNHVNARYGASRHFVMNTALDRDISLIASASGDGTGHSKGCGDGSAALRMAQLKTTKVFESGSLDFNDYFLKFVSDIGSKGYEANYMLEAQKNVAGQIQKQRDSVMGVNTDEEMLDIIKFQQGVGGIARYMTAIDEMLDRVINGMGRVGM